MWARYLGFGFLTPSWHYLSPQDIDEIISANLFKSEDDEGRKGALLGVIDLKASVLFNII